MVDNIGWLIIILSFNILTNYDIYVSIILKYECVLISFLRLYSFHPSLPVDLPEKNEIHCDRNQKYNRIIGSKISAPSDIPFIYSANSFFILHTFISKDNNGLAIMLDRIPKNYTCEMKWQICGIQSIFQRQLKPHSFMSNQSGIDCNV